MNHPNHIDCSCSGQIQIQQSHGDSNSEFANPSSLYLNMAGGVHHQPPYAAVPPKSSTTIMSRFESPASAFYATERCMGLPLPQYDSQLPNPPFASHFSRLNDSQFPLYQSDPTFHLSNTLQALVKPQYSSSPEKSNFPPINHASHPYKGNQDHTVGLGSYNFYSNQEKLSPTLSSPASVSTTTVSGSNGTVVSSKTRIRWTQDLHDKFVECVNRLGGAERKSDKTTHVEEDVHRLDAKTGLQIREALQLQLDVQRRLHEQLEIQRKLQLRIEEQGRQLKMMFDEQQKTSNDASNSIKDVDSFS
ncbi:myb family transcription factor PHL5-like [Senna tora]|uniref:Myb family transcription factor PHL5-like n=1 Tax=Senna tora TaxID=362788 RepID=A0A834TCR5_9FABA|nr:myb family transcription factor PHL5-like [Senna tora]